MDELSIVKKGYTDLFGSSEISLIGLPLSGSDRRYFRILKDSGSIIGAHNPNPEENEAFIGFTGHFRNLGLPVPEVLGYLPDMHVYFLTDLGDINLYTWLHQRDIVSGFMPETMELYRKVLDKLVLFQVEGIKGLDLNLCYPHKAFDRQSMIWDLNYFKYMFLKLLAVPFNERQLENDFNNLCDYLLEARQDYFLYRDFQTANIMIVDGSPWFIDYQGGRKGAPQYDVASLLYDAKIQMNDSDREKLLSYYVERFCSYTREDENKFRQHYTGFSMIRVMQALGAFGFRGLYEKKPTFIESIVPGVKLITGIIQKAEDNINLPELYKIIRSVPATSVFKELTEKQSK